MTAPRAKAQGFSQTTEGCCRSHAAIGPRATSAPQRIKIGTLCSASSKTLLKRLLVELQSAKSQERLKDTKLHSLEPEALMCRFCVCAGRVANSWDLADCAKGSLFGGCAMDGPAGFQKISAEPRRNDSLGRNRLRRRKMTSCNFQGQTLVKLDLFLCRERSVV